MAGHRRCTGNWRRPRPRRKPPAGELDAAQYELTTAETQRRAAEDEVLRLQGVKNQFDMLLSNLRESVENLAGEIEAIDGRIQEKRGPKRGGRADRGGPGR